jgi:hypothetical protein
MNEFDFSGLSSRSFEQLTQALALKVVGPGVTVFGDGPDGGREATFNGKVPFPHITDCWDGYGVIQAKYNTRPHGDARDGIWLGNELSKDLTKYVQRTRNLKCPDYFILCSNVILTPVDTVGTKDKITAIFSRFQKQLPIRDYRIWDYDQLCSFLRANEDVRRGYLAWISSGDVLAEAMNLLRTRKPEFESTIANFLQKEFLADQYANLEQAGHSEKDQTPLAKVFVDLPAYRERFPEPPGHRPDTQGDGIVNRLLEVGSAKLAFRSDKKPRLGDNSDENLRGRYVLIGGPGQGKTTVGQFLTQLYRASILLRRPESTLTFETHRALSDLKHQCCQEQIITPCGRRFPLRVVLNKLATELSSNDPNIKCNSLLDYLTKQISKLTDRSVSADDFREWLAAYPWLLVLDGLDEVPASSNRDEVLDAIQNFWVDAAGSDADVLVVATTRPQGYNDDFSPALYGHWWLAPLSREQALHYAARLVEERHKADAERRSKIMGRLKRAADQEATSRLMRSPLQVTILAALVDQIGQAPRDRWRLFHEYYGVIYRRETERDIPAASILSDYKKDIDAIHERVGLILQAESERRGGTSAELTYEQLERIVGDRLETQGHEGETLKALKKAILQAAEQRLVFLVGLEAKRYGFEIRSLQEFMAAEALVRDTDDVVVARLREIAPIINWRNVFLIAAGKCFSEREHLSDLFHGICAQLNDLENDMSQGSTLAGSQLALEILEDGLLVATQPRQARLIAREAMRLATLPQTALHRRLAAVYEVPLAGVFKEALTKFLQNEDSEEYLRAWTILISLTERRIAWAEDASDRNWPSEAIKIERILRAIAGGPLVRRSSVGNWLVRRINANAKFLSPSVLYSVCGLGNPPLGLDSWISSGIKVFYPFTSPDKERVIVRFPIGKGNGTLRVQSISHTTSDVASFLSEPDLSKKWLLSLSLARFLDNPSPDALAAALEIIAATFRQSEDFWPHYYTPWPLASILVKSQTAQQLTDMARHASQGKLGTRDDWIAAENRWITRGLTREDLSHQFNEGLPFDSSIRSIGLPLGVARLYSYERDPVLIQFLLSAATDSSSSERRGEIYDWLLQLLISVPYPSTSDRNLADDLLIAIIREALEPDLAAEGLLLLSDPSSALDTHWDAISSVAKNLHHYTQMFLPNSSHERADAARSIQKALSKILRKHPDRTEVFNLAAFYAPFGRPQIPTDLLDLVDYKNPGEKGMVALVKIASSAWQHNEVEDLATAVFEMDPDYRLMRFAIYLLRFVPISMNTDKLMQLFLTHCGSIDRNITGELLEVWDFHIRGRTSAFKNPSTWAQLGLPKVLAEISETLRDDGSG